MCKVVVVLEDDGRCWMTMNFFAELRLINIKTCLKRRLQLPRRRHISTDTITSNCKVQNENCAKERLNTNVVK